MSTGPLNDDAALLRDYLDERSDVAFTEVVRRHLELVAAVARRRAGEDLAAADAIVHATFHRLAEEAHGLRRQGMIVAWLHAAAVEAGPSTAASPRASATAANPPANWDFGLDLALGELPEEDRTALLLHYAEGRGLDEVALALDLGRAAAVLRLSRALDKLRAVLAGRGVRPGLTVLRDLLQQPSGPPAPPGRVELVARAALAAVPTVTEHESEAVGVLGSLVGMINSGVALGVAALVVAGTTLAWGYRTNTRLEGEITRLHGDNQTLAALQRDNRRLARLVAEAEELRREAAELPALRAAVFPGGPQAAAGNAVLTLAGAASLRWDNEPLAKVDVAARLQEFRRRFPAPETMLVIRANAVPAADVIAVLEEARKAQLTRIQIEGETIAEDGTGGWLF